MTLEGDAEKLLVYVDSLGLDASARRTRGWESIGAIVVDAALQRRQDYASTVRPRVAAVVERWPDAATTAGFRRRLNTGRLSEVISWSATARLTQIEHMTSVLKHEEISIETVQELRRNHEDPAKRTPLCKAVRGVRHVGPKTLDYFNILCGISTRVAIDVRIRRRAEAAGIDDLSYDHLAAVIHRAALRRGWLPRDLDAALREA